MPAIEGADPRAVVHLYDRMLAMTFKLGHVGAVFGTLGTVDLALWDLKAKMAGEPLWRLLGAGDRFVPAYASALDFGLSDEDLVRVHEQFAERGFTSAKLKGGRHVQDDLRRLGLLRDVFARNTSAPGPDVRCQRVLEPLPGRAPPAPARGIVRSDLGRGARAAVGRPRSRLDPPAHPRRCRVW